VGLLPELPPGTRQRLLLEGIATLGDLAGVGPERARAMLGARGPSLVRAAQGTDDRPVDRSQPPRSIAREVTLYAPGVTAANDASDAGRPLPDAPARAATEAELTEVVRHLADVLAMRLRSMGWFARTVTLCLRAPAGGGNGTRRSVTLREATALGDDLRAAAQSLLKTLWRRQPVGGIGLVLSNLQSAGPQMSLFPLARTDGSGTTLETVRARSGLRVLVDERYRPSVPRRVEREPDRTAARSVRMAQLRPSAEPRRRRTG
jgi:nucleotidyltransferase/DNA polymerase involved in DNA repair